MNNRTEKDHRRVKRPIHPMLGLKSEHIAALVLGGIELVHMIRKGQMLHANDAPNPSLAELFNRLAA